MSRAWKNEKVVNVMQGDYYVTGDEDVMLTTILGSCVAACMFDPQAKIGGLNHFLLPGEANSLRSSTAESYGVYLMELLVNGLLKHGARRERLVAKLFGGARTVAGLSDIGVRNADCAKRFLELEGITYLGGSLGGNAGRRIQFWPASGRARQLVMREINPSVNVAPKTSTVVSDGGDVELF